jgi:hypothetical protein
MGVGQQSKRDVAAKMRERYLKASSREEKGRLIDELVELTGYHRNHAKVLLRHGPPVGRSVDRPGRAVEYGPGVTAALVTAAEATGWICGKRPVWALPELVPALEREGALRLIPQVRSQLLGISAATIDPDSVIALLTYTGRDAGTKRPRRGHISKYRHA